MKVGSGCCVSRTGLAVPLGQLGKPQNSALLSRLRLCYQVTNGERFCSAGSDLAFHTFSCGRFKCYITEFCSLCLTSNGTFTFNKQSSSEEVQTSKSSLGERGAQRIFTPLSLVPVIESYTMFPSNGHCSKSHMGSLGHILKIKHRITFLLHIK